MVDSKAKRKRWVQIALLLAIVIVLCVVTRPTYHLLRTAWQDRDEYEAPPAGYVDDASRLNRTQVAEVYEIPLDHADPEGQLAQLLLRAKAQGRSVSIAGARHSMGGHTIYPGGISINMLPWKRMELNEKTNLLTVQAGALWKDVIAYLDEHGKSVAVMQSNNSFSVGGSLSVNCHGWQYDRPPIASTVESFRLMQADGEIVRCSRTENAELFSLALGGYGLFGIILDADLRVVPNERYRLEQFIVPVDQSLRTFDESIRDEPDVQMVYARLGIVPDRLFREVIINAFHREPEGAIPSLREPGMAELRRALFRGSAEGDYGKQLRWKAEVRLQPLLANKVFSRNQLLNEGVEVFQNRSSHSTDILHEYFVPRDHLAAFLDATRTIVKTRRPNLLNVTVRVVNEDHDTFLRYADGQMAALVMLFVQDRTDDAEKQMQDLTQELIDSALAHHGRYYLPYRLHATASQFEEAYPQAGEFFRLKRKYDPDEIFQNEFYRRYGMSNQPNNPPLLKRDR